jgi:hypothetical protein
VTNDTGRPSSRIPEHHHEAHDPVVAQREGFVMPQAGADRNAFVARIERRRSLVYRLGRLRRRLGGAARPLETEVYDRTFRSDAEAVAYHYARHNDHLPDLDDPVWLNEKIRWQFLHHPNPLMTLAADKIAVRDYLAFKGARIAPPALIAVGCDPADLQRIDLPGSFALKSAHGSGQVHLERSGACTPQRVLAARAAAWWRIDQWRRTGEMHYRAVPKRWLVEELVPAARRRLEYKIACFNGEPSYITVITERGPEGYRRATYDCDWRPIGLRVRGLAEDPHPVPRPASLDLMLAEARRLSEDFLHVRVDFMAFDDRLMFSELTFASLGARLPFEPHAANAALGARMDLARAPDLLARGRGIVARLATQFPEQAVARPAAVTPQPLAVAAPVAPGSMPVSVDVAPLRVVAG